MIQDAKITAKKIRTELKTTFKNCKFSVKIDRYSMGQSVNIDWENGASVPEVEDLINKIEAEYNAQGIQIRSERSSFIFTHRRVSEENRKAIKLSILKELLKNPIEGFNDSELRIMINSRAYNTTFF